MTDCVSVKLLLPHVTVMFLQKITCILIFDEPQLSGQPPFVKIPLAGSLKVVS